jgi:acyl carrier protein
MNKIMDVLLRIFKDRFDLDLSGSCEEIQNEHLLGSKIGLGAGDLLYLYFDIEKEFGIQIPQEHIVSGKFSSLSNISQMIHEQLEEKAS